MYLLQHGRSTPTNNDFRRRVEWKTELTALISSLKGELLAVLALILFSTTIFLTKVASAYTKLTLGFLIAVSMNVLLCGLLFIAELAVRPEPLEWNTNGFVLFIFAGIFSTFLGRWFFYESAVIYGPAKASVYQISSPLFAAIIAWIFLGETLTPIRMAGMVLAVLGLLVVTDVRALYASRKSGATASLAGAAHAPAASQPSTLGTALRSVAKSSGSLGIAGSLAYAVGNVLRGAGVHTWHEPVLGTLLGATAGVALHIIFSSGVKESIRGIRDAHRMGLFLFAMTGVTGILAQICTIASLRYVPVSVTALITLSMPALVFPASYFL
ncbi:MAG: family transporter, partial [Noviherbaspirillum sp.]|nr:family transporter [Noviherbaspirillum sp.]